MSDDDSTWVWAQHADTGEVQKLQRAMLQPGSSWHEITAEQAVFETKEMRGL